jgi:hypothetical protein
MRTSRYPIISSYTQDDVVTPKNHTQQLCKVRQTICRGDDRRLSIPPAGHENAQLPPDTIS